MIERTIFTLASGRWQAQISESSTGEVFELTHLAFPENRMRVPLPFSWRQLSQESLYDLVRSPEVRMWTDPDGTFWRVAEIGPGTHYQFPLHSRHLLFDSDQTWAGIVEFPPPDRLGELTSEELLRFRNGIRDLAGMRRRFRPKIA